MVDDDDDDVMEEDSEDEWLRERNEELGLCPICGEEGCRSAH